MNLKAFLAHLLKEDTPDEEERVGTVQAVREKPSHGSPTIDEDAGSDEDTQPGDRTVCDGNLDFEQDDDQDLVDLDEKPVANPRASHRILSQILSFLAPSRSGEDEIQAYIPHYRILPIFSGITIPFSILLEIPALTGTWYTHFNRNSVTASKPNPPLLDVGVAISIFCAVLANACLVIRFLERRIRTMTILCILFLSIHDMINVAALAAFAGTRENNSYAQAFWMTLCSTIMSMFTNVTLIIDLVRTRDFKRSGSGLTRRQRSLVIIIIGLFCYIGLGALVNALLLDLTFINGLYFTVVTIETIGFGDTVPNSRTSRVFVCFYATLGVINIAFVVGYIRETVLEGLDFGYRKRVLAIQERRRATHRRRRAEKRWRHSILWRLRQRQAPVWIPDDTSDCKSLWSKLARCFWDLRCIILSTAKKTTLNNVVPRRGMKLNLWALPRCQLEAAALEAGVPLDTLLPVDFYETYDQDACDHAFGTEHHAVPSWFAIHSVYHRGDNAPEPPTHRRLAAMAAMLTRFSFFVYESGGNPLPSGYNHQDALSEDGQMADQGSSGSLQGSEDSGDYHADVAGTEKKAYITRSSLSWCWFLVFWMGGAAIFKVTEGWTYGSSIYFCFISFSTIGYGDLTPTTPAGRSIFVVWALIGVATMTIFISVVSEAYTARYKGILGRNNFKHVVQRYRKRTKVEVREKVQQMDTSLSTGSRVHHSMLEKEDVGYALSLTSATAEDGVASTSKPDPYPHVQRVQRSLEQLPQQILTETRSIEQYIQLIGNLDGHTAESEKLMDESIWSLVDEVMGGRKVPDYTKKDLLKDGESRQTLIMLGVERSLKELVNISEQAIAAIQERDRIITAIGQEKEDA